MGNIGNERDRTAEIDGAFTQHGRHAGVLLFAGREDALRFFFLIRPVLAGHGHHGQNSPVGVGQGYVGVDRNARAARFVELQRDRNRPGQTLGQALVREDAVVLFLGHEAFERAIDARRDAFQVGDGAVGEFDAGQGVRVFESRATRGA